MKGKEEYAGAALMLVASTINMAGNAAGIAMGRTNGNPFFYASLTTSCLYMLSAVSSLSMTYERRKTFAEAERERNLPELKGIIVAR